MLKSIPRMRESRIPILLLILLLTSIKGQADPNPGGVLQKFLINQFAGSGIDSIEAMTSDAAGNLYVAGKTTSPDFPTKNAAQASIGGGRGDAFVAKLAPGGSVVLWATFLGGSALDAASTIALDPQGNVYVGGTTLSLDFPITTVAALGHAFVVAYDRDGNVIYSTVFGGEFYEAVTGLAIDPFGNAFVAGWTNSKAFSVTPGAFQTKAGGSDGFAVKLNDKGTVVYASYLPNFGAAVVNSYYDQQRKVAVLPETGGFALFGGWTGVISRLSPDGSALSSVAQQPGPIYAMQADGEGNVYVAGQTRRSNSRACFQGLRTQDLPAGDVYVSKLTPNDLQQVFSRTLAGDCQTRPGNLQISRSGEITLSEWVFDSFLLRDPVLLSASCNSSGGGAVSRISADGSTILFSSFVDSCGAAPAVAIAEDGSIYAGVTGNSYDSINSLHAGVLRIPVSAPSEISVDAAVNAFSGTGTFVTSGMLMTITGQNIAASFVDLGLTYPGPLPIQLGGVQVLFDGVAAEILQVAEDHVICVVPMITGREIVNVQVVNGSQSAKPFVIRFEVYGVNSYLTQAFPQIPQAGSIDGNIRNEDGMLNDADHPAAPGSLVTLFGTGLPNAGPVDILWNAPPRQQQYEILYFLSGNAFHTPGLVHGMYAIQFRIPSAPGAGVYAVPIPGVLTRFEIGRERSGLGIYVR